MSNVRLTAQVKSVKVMKSSIARMKTLIEQQTTLDCSKHELVVDGVEVIGFKFDENTHSIVPMIELLETFPVVSSVKTDQYEKHQYQVGNSIWDVQLFFAKGGTMMVVQLA